MRRTLALTGRLALAGLGLLASPRLAHATEYEVFIDVDTEEELYDLYVSEQIGEDTFNTLVELYRRGIDLNEDNRAQLYSLPNLTYDDVDAILAYRTEVGTIRAPADLAAAGVLTRDKLASILAFIQATPSRPKLTATHGWVRYQTAYAISDSVAPPMALQARITTLRQLTIGAAGLLTRQRPGQPQWDPNRETLLAPEMGVRAHVPKFFAQWDTDRWGVIVGTYRIGFGQRLTFDSTTRYTPNGFFLDDALFRDVDLGRVCREGQGELAESPCAGDARYVYGTKDWRWRDGQRGIAIGAKELHLPVGWVQLYGFGSWNRRQVYQYDFYNKDTCDDPFSDEDLCKAPATLVSREGQDTFDPAASHVYQTLPNMYDEFLGGGNFSWFYDRRTHVGVTGYGATALWLPEGPDLDFRPPSTMPYGGSWGAVGADMNWGHRWSDLGLEVARSFDSMRSVTPDQGGGGFAGILRHTSTFGANELELTARYYDKNYANPYAGPIAQADQYDGNRARDELGGRIRYGGRIADRLDLRGIADVWARPSFNFLPKIQTYIRADVDINEWFRPGLWLQYRNTDLRPGFKDGCVETGDLRDIIQIEDDGTRTYRSGCVAELGQITGRLGFRPFRGKLSITAQYQHEFIDDPGVDEDDDGLSDYIRQDAAATLIVRANPIRSFRISARLRYLFEDVKDNTRLEQSAWAYFDLSYVFAKVFLVRARYDIYGWLDDRDSTALRNPSPEHRLRLVLEARF